LLLSKSSASQELKEKILTISIIFFPSTPFSASLPPAICQRKCRTK
jgi:hypothetical protein